MSDFDSAEGPVASRLAILAADPEAPRGALHCAWVPGTGHCCNRPCSALCLFRTQREAEAQRVAQARRRRRRAQQAFAGRTAAYP